MVAQTICAGQVFYWRRQRTVAVPSPDKNIVISHFLAFASKIGLIFGGALFSLYFPRHVPEFDLDYLGLSWRGGILIAILFALYCYTLELERLGDALQEKPGQEALGEPD
ncbi:hypothetical protein J2Y55_003861 [Bosea sp. BE125]|uniref:hypothetical protein n=1 Tax=Bosea sp. BE125 TaxID=2817909 RepID=UPI0028545947|nr:hypothetical protein [Bosea sp. BE125]MDR6872842.1 hypothetical protein [Bosea sp. BE125]